MNNRRFRSYIFYFILTAALACGTGYAGADQTPAEGQESTAKGGKVSPEALRRNFGARVPLDLAAALSGPGPMVVAEVKRASPSRGGLAPGLDAGACAFEYQDHGAAAISVLTEPEFFSGALADLDAALEKT